jgi:peptidoglycan/xylan/chitin deacetylase (PgdA/CDA1 family)
LSETGRSNGLRLGHPAFYVLKAGLTRARSAAWAVRSGGHANGDGLRILFYHRVSADKDELAVDPRSFRRQMEHLASAGYDVVDVLAVADLLDAGRLPPRTVGLSFDDGYLDVAEDALPILADHGFRATVFVAPAVIDGTASFEWYERQPPLLGWDDIVELDREATLRFESHSLTHPNLLSVPDEQARREVEGSKLALEERLRRPVHLFSYPAGLFGPRERSLVIDAGFRAAVSCEPGVNGPDVDRFSLRRRQIDARDTLLDFKAKLGGGHDSPPPFRRLYRRFRYGAGAPARASSRR